MDDLSLRIKVLEEEVKRLTDENASLWDMLEEIKAADVRNFQEILQKAHDELQLERLMSLGPVGEA